VRRWLKTLGRRESEILRLRFGLGEGPPRTLDQVGRRFRVTRERARQIQLTALKKLRHSPQYKTMQDYYE
jgi:RNA polymerase primary sigma factor